MTEVAATTGYGQTTERTTTASSSASNAADYDTFLNLLVAQLKNQDPTNPSDPTQFLSQLASFSGVEQQIQANDKLASLIALTQAGNAAQLVGNFVVSPDGTMAGVVSSVTLGSNGPKVNLESGQSFTLESGTQVFAS
jgi:flagellar basal-body rod modification protein FlgD